jgi:stage IV sporulation protein FB
MGTEVRIHLTFLLLIAWIAISAGAQGGSTAALDAVTFVLAVFVCVVLHEFGHALMARCFGIRTRDITLLPIGGVASIEQMPEKPGQELLIAIAGPLVNVAIAAALFWSFGDLIQSEVAKLTTDTQEVSLLTRLALVNVGLVAFNLIPAFPMDGGRVLRALLSIWIGRTRATRVAAGIGQAAAFALGFAGLFGNPLLVFIALFVFLAATHESYAIELSEATKGVSMRQATITAFETLNTQATVGQAVDKLLGTSQREFPVTDAAGHLRGVLTRDGMIRALAATGPDTPVIDAMDRDVPTIGHRAPLAQALATLESAGQPLLVVVDDEQRVFGLVTLENLAEYMMVTEAGRHWRKPAAVRAT